MEAWVYDVVDERIRYEKCMTRRAFKDPLQKINEKAILIDMNVKSLKNSIITKINNSKSEYVELLSKLDALSPIKTLARGYNIAEKDGKVISKVKNLKPEDQINLKFIDGRAKAKVIELQLYIKGGK